MDLFENDIFGFTFHRQLNNRMSINIDNNLNYKIIYAEISLEILLLIISYFAENSISEIELENLNGTNIIEENDNLNIDKEEKVATFYEAYLDFKYEKTLLNILFFLTLICIVSTNISTTNTINLSILILFIVLSLLQPLKNKNIGLLSQVFFSISFLMLISQYVMNIKLIKNKKINAYVGIIEFEKNLGIFHFISLSLGFLIACSLNKYDYNMDEFKVKCREFLRSNCIDFKQLKEKNKTFLAKSFKYLTMILFYLSSFFYKLISLLWILFHVSIIMFFNFIIISLGYWKNKGNFRKYYLLPSFFVNLFFILVQYIYNLNGFFIFDKNKNVYKIMEIIGFYKYFKWKIQEYSSENLADIYLTTDSKFQGLLTDMLVIVLLFVFGFFTIKKHEKKGLSKYKSDNTPILEEEKPIGEHNKEVNEVKKRLSESNLNIITKYLIEKSFILSILIIFSCSITKFDLIHSIYFFLFFLLIVFSEKYFKKLWNVVLISNQLIIIFLYFWNIFAVNYFNLEEEVNPAVKNIFTYLGLKIDPKQIFFVSYCEHIILAMWGLLQNFLFSSKYMKSSRKRENINTNTDLSFISEEEECIRNLYKFPDSLKTILFISTYLCLLILSLIKPLSFQGLIFLFFMMLIVFVQLFLIKEEKSRFLNFLINLINFIAIVIITFKYLINFPFFMDYIKEFFNLQNNFIVKNTINRVEGLEDISHTMLFKKDPNKINNLEDFGLDQENLTLKLLYNCLLIIFLKIICSFDDGNDKLEESRVELEKQLKNEDRNDLPSKIMIYVKVLFYQIVYLHSTKILITISAIIALNLETMIGGLIFIILFICLIEGKNNNWKYSFFPLFFFSMIVLNFIYLCNLKLFRKWMTKDYEWLGIYSPKSSDEVFSKICPFLTIMFISYFSRISQKYKEYYIDKSCLIETETSNIDEKTVEKDESKSNLNLDGDKIQLNLTQVSKKEEIFSEASIIESLSEFWFNFDYFWYLYGFYIILFMILMISFFKVNALSLVYIGFVGFYSFNVYFRTDYKSKSETTRINFNQIRKNWLRFAIFILICSICQYLNMLWFPPSWKIAKPWESYSFFCSKEGKTIFSSNIHYKNISDYEYCVNNWKAWLNIDNIQTKEIFYNFLSAFLIFLTLKYFTHNDMFKREEFNIRTAKDFTIPENKNNDDIIKYVMFIYFKKLILIYIIFISLIYSYLSTNIIYGGFLFFSFFLLFKEGKLDKEKNKLWKFVQYYNFIVLVAFILFQTPFLQCPVNRDSRSYIGIEECVEEEDKIYRNPSLYNYPKHKVDAIYMLIVQIFGIQKLDFYLLIVGNLSLFLIYIAALVQQIIFDHPYQEIVDNYNLREKQINCKSRAFKIVQDIHLTNNLEYRRVNTLNNILQEKLIRLDRKISEYGNLSHNSKLVTRIEDENDELEELNPVNKIREEIEIYVETLISNDLNTAGLIKFKEVKNKVNEIFSKLNTKYSIEPRNYYKIEKGFKEEFLKDLLIDIKKFQLNQLILDKKKIYLNDFNGLNIASKEFNIITENKDYLEKDMDLDMELLKKLFLTENLQQRLLLNPPDSCKSRRGENIIVGDDPKQEIKENLEESNNVNHILNENLNNDTVLELPKQVIKAEDPELLRKMKSIFFTIVDFLKSFFYRWIDKTLLIDLVSNHKQKISGFFDLMTYSIYSNIELFIMLAFIFNNIHDASILSCIYPLTYFGYGLIEYPFPSKTYWRYLIIYSLSVITSKLVYQFPLFCGYPFLTIFNIFNDNFCEIYILNDQEIFEEFNYTLGLRKYSGPYSYPKNQGIISGIMWDIIILVLLLVQRSLQKSKGIWNFISIKNEYLKTPIFDVKKANQTVEQDEIPQFNQLPSENESANNIEHNQPDNFKTMFSNFLKRLIPEIYLDKKFPVYKPGIDYYPLSFAVLLVIVVYTLFTFGKMTGKTGQTLKEALDRQQFSTDLIGGILLIVIVILLDRVIYKLRSINNEFIKEMFPEDQPNLFEDSNGNENNTKNEENIRISNIALIFKIVLHYSLLLFVHYVLFFVLPKNNKLFFSSNNQLIYFYFLCCSYFYLSSSQLKYGFPLVTKGQYFADSTAFFSRNVPFLFELRAIFDWTITKTSLDLFQWFKMEDAYANLYDVRADMDLRKARFRGEERGLLEKCQWGLVLFIFLMGCLFLPMLLFSTFNPSLIENKVLGGAFSINYVIKNKENNLTMYSLNLFETKNMKINDIKDKREYEYLKRTLISHADDVDERKIQKIQIVNYSQQDWIISPPTIFNLIEHLEKKDIDSYIVFKWEFRRHFPLNNKVIAGNNYVKLNPNQIYAFKNIMYALRNGDKNLNKYSLDLSSAFPKVIRLSNRNYKYIKFDTKQKIPYKDKTDLRMNLIKENDRDIYWLVNQKNVKEIDHSPFYNKLEELEMILISDDVISSFFGFNTDSGSVPLNIVGIYVTIVYTIGRFVRIFFDKISMKVIYEELPEPMEIFELCEGIFIYRIQRKLDKENSLYDLLIRIYRSPEVLIRITGQRVKYLRNDEVNKNQELNIKINQ